MKKFILSLLCTVILFVPSVSFAKESQAQSAAKYPVDANAKNVETIVDTTWKNSPDILEDSANNMVVPTREDCGCDEVIKKRTNMIYIDNTMPIEYTIHKGKLVLLKRPDLHYYTQNFTQTWWNQYTGKFAQKAAEGAGTYVSFRIGGKMPYMARLLKLKDRFEKPFQYGDYALGALAWMQQEKVPLWGDIISASVPKSGTEISLIYISETGKNNSWKYRARFEVEKDGTVKVDHWVVD